MGSIKFIDTNKIMVDDKNFNRLAIVLMEKNNCKYDEALRILDNLKLFLKCDENIRKSLSLQVALLTALNTGKRAFLGGVSIKIPPNVKLLLEWPGCSTLNELITILGGKIIIDSKASSDIQINFGPKALTTKEIRVITSGWIGGIENNEDNLSLYSADFEIPLTGVMAGALAVGKAFLKVADLDKLSFEDSILISLWKPELAWNNQEAQGPKLSYLPKKFWVLGLGHLGQAYLWNLLFLPYKNRKEVIIVLQDFDRIELANISAGLLSEESNINSYKTREFSKILEKKGFNTIITERKFDKSTKRNDEEPYVALCGFDKAESRSFLEDAGFELIIEAGLGGNLDNFDEITLHTFPNAVKTPYQIWDNVKVSTIEHKQVLSKFNIEEGCGIIAQTLAGKAISSSFVGAFTGSFVISELIKALHDGDRTDTMVLSLRDVKNRKILSNSKYKSEAIRNGYVEI